MAEFPEIMAAGGFDAVIGNPPWGSDLSDGELSYTLIALAPANML
jgi:predicted RNA methylase